MTLLCGDPSQAHDDVNGNNIVARESGAHIIVFSYFLCDLLLAVMTSLLCRQVRVAHHANCHSDYTYLLALAYRTAQESS